MMSYDAALTSYSKIFDHVQIGGLCGPQKNLEFFPPLSMSFPIEIPEKLFRAWDKVISRYIWTGKKGQEYNLEHYRLEKQSQTLGKSFVQPKLDQLLVHWGFQLKINCDVYKEEKSMGLFETNVLQRDHLNIQILSLDLQQSCGFMW